MIYITRKPSSSVPAELYQTAQTNLELEKIGSHTVPTVLITIWEMAVPAAVNNGTLEISRKGANEKS